MTQDVIGEALVRAFADENLTARITGPTTIGISVPDVGDLSTDIGEWRAHAGRVAPADLPAFAADFVRGFARGIRKQLDRAQAAAAVDIESLLAAEALRVRIYPEAALAEPPGMRDALLTRTLAPGLVETVVVDRPDSIVPLNRADLGGRPEDQVFGAALHASLSREPHNTGTDEIWGVPITHIGETHRYIGSRVHVLRRFLGPAPYGALVSFPVPEYLIVHEIGGTHVIAAMEAMQALARTHVEKGENALTAQVYWWRPGAYEQLPEAQALAGGQVPDLRPVEIEVDHQEKSITPRTAETQELVDLWMRANA
ncbi:hypothetical protein [Actinoallomurus iriomotensis]|uniref:Uncharacterized protein n=1 Tax=Actinoallomurus iriomotensis TaxID=478107 RepID=A0A9W6RF40_9ACTN|nr:hypothetical protein [Actinoallomurus iriomotensis]GLY72917.1 hypothetical protein Airi01_011840 [Actinoallomurus iriomotensis]